MKKKIMALVTLLTLLCVPFTSFAAETASLSGNAITEESPIPTPISKDEEPIVDGLIPYLRWQRSLFGIDKPLQEFAEYMIANDSGWTNDADRLFCLLAEAYPGEPLIGTPAVKDEEIIPTPITDEEEPLAGGESERLAYLGIMRRQFGEERPLSEFVEFITELDNWELGRLISLLGKLYPDEITDLAVEPDSEWHAPCEGGNCMFKPTITAIAEPETSASLSDNNVTDSNFPEPGRYNHDEVHPLDATVENREELIKVDLIHVVLQESEGTDAIEAKSQEKVVTNENVAATPETPAIPKTLETQSKKLKTSVPRKAQRTFIALKSPTPQTTQPEMPKTLITEPISSIESNSQRNRLELFAEKTTEIGLENTPRLCNS